MKRKKQEAEMQGVDDSDIDGDLFEPPTPPASALRWENILILFALFLTAAYCFCMLYDYLFYFENSRGRCSLYLGFF